MVYAAVSATAALQAPVIMMSQNRVEARDRLRGENDYKVNPCYAARTWREAGARAAS